MPETKELKVTSPSFENNARIPPRFTCDGNNISPELKIENIPPETASLVLIVDDPDAPGGTWVHWVLYGIQVPEGKTALVIPANGSAGSPGKNSWEQTGYGGPCPPTGAHRYFFRAYALNTDIDFEMPPTKQTLENAIHGNIIAQGQLVGLYERTR